MTTHQSRFRLSNPGAFIASLPAVLGFVPEKSLVLVSLEWGELGAVMRVDLSDELPDQIERLAELAGASGADSAVAVIVDADGALCAMCYAGYCELCDELGIELQEHGVTLQAAFVVDTIEADGHWQRVDGCGEQGRVADPNASPLAAAAVLDGRRLYGRRADLQAVVAVGDPDRAAALSDFVREYAQRRESDPQTGTEARAGQEVRSAIAAAVKVRNGGDLGDAELANLACSLTDVMVRDTLYALAVGADAGPAEALWSMLARTLPEPWRVEALVLLAFSAYVRGDGPLAGISLDAALRSAPDHRMAGMLDTALQSGMRPEQIGELAGTGYRLARRLGVRLPPRRQSGRQAV